MRKKLTHAVKGETEREEKASCRRNGCVNTNTRQDKEENSDCNNSNNDNKGVTVICCSLVLVTLLSNTCLSWHTVTALSLSPLHTPLLPCRPPPPPRLPSPLPTLLHPLPAFLLYPCQSIPPVTLPSPLSSANSRPTYYPAFPLPPVSLSHLLHFLPALPCQPRSSPLPTPAARSTPPYLVMVVTPAESGLR